MFTAEAQKLFASEDFRRSAVGRAFLAIVLAVVLVASATLLNILLGRYESTEPFTIYCLAVVVAVSYGDGLAGALAIALSAVSIEQWVPTGLPDAATPSARFAPIAVFVLLAGAIVLLIHGLRLRGRDGERHLAGVLDTAMDAIVTVDHERRITAFNPAAERIFRCAAGSVVGTPVDRFIPERFRETYRVAMARPSSIGGIDRAADMPSGLRSDGEEFPIEASVFAVGAGAKRLTTIILRDITRREAIKVEVGRLNRLHAARSGINQAVVQIKSREELLNRVCEVLVETGGFCLVWIGRYSPETRTIVPQAQYGDTDGYLTRVTVSAEDRPEGRGPTGTAFREGRPCITEDMLNDPNLLPWHDEIARQPFRASASFPILRQGKVACVLTVYALEPRYFFDKEQALLTEAAADISFALDALALDDVRLEAQAAAAREEEFSKTMIECLPGIMYLYDETGRFLRWNKNFEVVSGYSPDEIARMQPLDFFAEPDRPVLEQRIAEVMAQGESSVEAPFLMKTGMTIPYFFTGRRIRFNEQDCLVGVGIDISERKRSEIALRELNETLELNVTQRTAQLQTALTRAEAADRLKSAFLATMSHELRTPLNSIIGFTGIILQGLAGPLNAEQSKQLGMVRASSRHLLALINDILDISKIEAGEVEVSLAPFDLIAAVERVVALSGPLAASKGLHIVSNVPPGARPLRSDQRRVEQILLNLLNNAIKFTDVGNVTLTLEQIAERHLPFVAIRIADTGIGIKPQDLASLFQPFRQIDTGLARQREGTGLGLAISQRLAAMLGGGIEVESVWRQGSVFTLKLPVQGNG
jgi:PAS domain S-box-containing protein